MKKRPLLLALVSIGIFASYLYFSRHADQQATASVGSSLPRNAQMRKGGVESTRVLSASQDTAPVAVSANVSEVATDPFPVNVDMKSVQRGVDLKYGYILNDPTLSAATRERMRQLFSQRNVDLSDLFASMAQQGINPGSPERTKLLAEEGETFERKLSEAAGANAEKVMALFALRNQMQHIEGVLSPNLAQAGAPLTDPQKLELAVAMKSVGFLPGRESFAGSLDEPVDPTTGLIPLYQRLATAARSILTPEQLAALKTSQDQMISRRKAGSSK